MVGHVLTQKTDELSFVYRSVQSVPFGNFKLLAKLKLLRKWRCYLNDAATELSFISFITPTIKCNCLTNLKKKKKKKKSWKRKTQEKLSMLDKQAEYILENYLNGVDLQAFCKYGEKKDRRK